MGNNNSSTFFWCAEQENKNEGDITLDVGKTAPVDYDDSTGYNENNYYSEQFVTSRIMDQTMTNQLTPDVHETTFYSPNTKAKYEEWDESMNKSQHNKETLDKVVKMSMKTLNSQHK